MHAFEFVSRNGMKFLVIAETIGQAFHEMTTRYNIPTFAGISCQDYEAIMFSPDARAELNESPAGEVTILQHSFSL